MVISHKYKYVFIELPRTGSSAIAKELIEKYDGKEIIAKHAKYTDFLKYANKIEKQYFAFSCIRNPIERTYSFYTKLKNDQMNNHLSYSAWLERLKKTNIFRYYFLKERLHYVSKTNTKFTNFLNRYYVFPYDDWSSLSHKELDYIIHFENIENDFYTFLRINNIKQKGKLPVVNQTQAKRSDFLNTPEIINTSMLVHIFGPFMQKWNIPFPESWGEIRVKKWSVFLYTCIGFFRKLLWKYISFRNFKKKGNEY